MVTEWCTCIMEARTEISVCKMLKRYHRCIKTVPIFQLDFVLGSMIFPYTINCGNKAPRLYSLERLFSRLIFRVAYFRKEI